MALLVRVMEGFAGGGTLVAALTGNPTFQLVAGIEIAPDFADEWQAQPVATLARPFTLQVPHDRCGTPASAFLNPPDSAQDRADAERIVRTIIGLRAQRLASRRRPRLRLRGDRGSELRVPRFLTATARSPRGLACKRLSACDRCGRPRLNAFTATRCLPSTTQRPCRYWGRGCRRGCFVRCFASWPITFYM